MVPDFARGQFRFNADFLVFFRENEIETFIERLAFGRVNFRALVDEPEKVRISSSYLGLSHLESFGSHCDRDLESSNLESHCDLYLTRQLDLSDLESSYFNVSNLESYCDLYLTSDLV